MISETAIVCVLCSVYVFTTFAGVVFMIQYFRLVKQVSRFHHPDCTFKNEMIANCCENNDVALLMLRTYMWSRPRWIKQLTECDVVCGFSGEDYIEVKIPSELWLEMQESVAQENEVLSKCR